MIKDNNSASFYVSVNGHDREWHPTLDSALEYVRWAFEDGDVMDMTIERAED